MKKIRKITDKLREELMLLRCTRKSIDDFSMSFLTNFSQNSRLMHAQIKKNNNLFEVAYRQYYVFLISCWETFFRDLFVYIHTDNQERTDDLFIRMQGNIEKINVGDDITLAEILSKSFNFQNLDDLEKAYNGLWESDFLNYICNTSVGYCGFSGKISNGFKLYDLFSDWQDIIEETFSIRHRIVHDANFRPKIDINLIQKSEAIFLLIPQIATHFIAQKFDFKRVMLSSEMQDVPYIFNMQDIFASDWHIVKQ